MSINRWDSKEVTRPLRIALISFLSIFLGVIVGVYFYGIIIEPVFLKYFNSDIFLFPFILIGAIVAAFYELPFILLLLYLFGKFEKRFLLNKHIWVVGILTGVLFTTLFNLQEGDLLNFSLVDSYSSMYLIWPTLPLYPHGLVSVVVILIYFLYLKFAKSKE